MTVAAALVSALLQVLLFAAIPFVVYLATRRRTAGFLEYVGLSRPAPGALATALGVAAVTTPLLLWVLMRPELRVLLTAPGTVSGRLRDGGPGGTTLALLLIYAWVQTALAEEILLRGFLAKRIIGRLGFGRGNAVQALLFGLMHLVLFGAVLGSRLDPARAAALVLPTTMIGWLLGWLMVRRGNGSILPAWVAHGATNTIAFLAVAFTGG